MRIKFSLCNFLPAVHGALVHLLLLAAHHHQPPPDSVEGIGHCHRHGSHNLGFSNVRICNKIILSKHENSSCHLSDSEPREDAGLVAGELLGRVVGTEIDGPEDYTNAYCPRVAPRSQNQIGADSKTTIFVLFWPKSPNFLHKTHFSENTIFTLF